MLDKASARCIGQTLRTHDRQRAAMYAVTPAVADHWRALFAWVAEVAGVPLT